MWTAPGRRRRTRSIAFPRQRHRVATLIAHGRRTGQGRSLSANPPAGSDWRASARADREIRPYGRYAGSIGAGTQRPRTGGSPDPPRPLRRARSMGTGGARRAMPVVRAAPGGGRPGSAVARCGRDAPPSTDGRPSRASGPPGAVHPRSCARPAWSRGYPVIRPCRVSREASPRSRPPRSTRLRSGRGSPRRRRRPAPGSSASATRRRP